MFTTQHPHIPNPSNINSGTNTVPVYTLQNDAVGGLPVEDFDRNLTIAIADFNQDGKADLITGDRKGKLKIYTDIIKQLNLTFRADTSIIWNELTNTYTTPKLSGFIFPTTADLDNDLLPDLLVGTQAGGIIILKNTLKVDNPGGEPTEAGFLYPNPTNRYVYLNLSTDSEIILFSMLGQQLTVKQHVPANREIPIDLKNLPAGVYLLRIYSGEVSVTKKIVLFN